MNLEGVATMRSFTALTAGMATVLCLVLNGTDAAPLKTFAEAIEAAQWNPAGPASFCFVQATDLHVNDTGPLKMENKFAGANFADDINRLVPRPKFLAITGDTVSDTFRSPSSWAKAEQGFRDAKERIFARLAIPYHIILGNNGCSPEAFHKVWPDAPVRWSFDCEGIHFVGLYGYNLWQPENSNHAGIVLDPEQLDWLKGDLAAAAKSKTLVLFTHEPLQDADCHLIRGQLAPLIAGFAGEVWNIAGHNHMNATNAFMLGEKTVRILQTTSPIGNWRPDKGVYRIIYATDGKLVASSLRWITKDGDPVGFEPAQGAESVSPSLTNDDVLGKDLLLKVAVGAGDKPLRIESKMVEDRISNLRIRKGGSVTYRIPLGGAKAEIGQIALLAEADTMDAAIELSQDGQTWMPVSEVNVKKAGWAGTILSFGFEPKPDAADIFIRMKTGEKEAKLYGLALMKRP
jgi:hypothetical protein